MTCLIEIVRIQIARIVTILSQTRGHFGGVPRYACLDEALWLV